MLNETDLLENKIITFKYFRAKINDLQDKIRLSEQELFTPSLNIAKTSATDIALQKLQEARMWLGIALRDLGQDTPYIQAENLSNPMVDQEADTGKDESTPTD